MLSEAELESRYHVRVERYVKDVMIEMETLAEMLDTQILPAAYAYLGTLAEGAAKAKQGGIKAVPQKAAAEAAGKLVAALQAKAGALHAAIKKAHALHGDPSKCAAFLTAGGHEAMAACRALSDRLELSIGDAYWPLPRYREMLFPV